MNDSSSIVLSVDKLSRLPGPTIGDRWHGHIVRVTPKFAVVRNVDGNTGHLTRSEMWWLEPPPRSEEVFRRGAEIDVEVIDIQPRPHTPTYPYRVRLSHRNTIPNPWDRVEELHSIGSRTRGKVVEVRKYGAVVALASGLRGLVHNTEASWTNQMKASDILRVDDAVEVTIKALDLPRHHIDLTCRHPGSDPWPLASTACPVGARFYGKVASRIAFGVLVRLPNGYTGLLHKSEMRPALPWPRVGSDVTVRVLTVDTERRRLGLTQE